MKKIFTAVFGIMVICTALFAKGIMNSNVDIFYEETTGEVFSANEDSVPHPHYECFHDDSETIFLDRINL